MCHLKKIKSVIKRIVFFVLHLWYKIIFLIPSDKRKILIYTDSRGFLVDCFACYKTPRKSYIEMLHKNFRIDYQICTQKHTTIIDFLDYVSNKNLEKYAYIVLHLGIVDFSPRPMNQLKLVFHKKNKLAQRLFPGDKMNYQQYNDLYESEKTFSLYEEQFLEKIILPELNQISKKVPIVWLGVNSVDLNWNGNYVKKRPKNINNILKYQGKIIKYLDTHATNITYIDIDNILEFNLKKHTLDNMHLSIDGFKLFYSQLIKELKV